MTDITKFYISLDLLKRLLLSATISFGILLAEYVSVNFFCQFFDDSSLLSLINTIHQTKPVNEDDVVYFNIGYDKELVAVKDEYGDSIGNTVITNRNILVRLLDIARKANYKYLFLDIRFEKGYNSPYDSILFSQIKSMKNIVISSHSDADGYEIADSSLITKSARADYLSTYFSGFTRYGFVQDGKESVALRIFKDLDHGNVRKFGPLYFSNGHLCNNNHFLTFRNDDAVDSDAPFSIYPPFGGELLKLLTEEEIVSLMQDKIIAVGDMDNDIHSTYANNIPGPLLNVRAYQHLRLGLHHYNILMNLILFCVYATISYFLLYISSINKSIFFRKIIKRYPVISFIMITLGWGCILFTLKILMFIFFDASIIISIPTLVFSILSMPENYANFKLDLK